MPVQSGGRVDFPPGMLRLIGVRPGDSVELFFNDRSIAVALHSPGCVFCGEADAAARLRGKGACSSCLNALRSASAAPEEEASLLPRSVFRGGSVKKLGREGRLVIPAAALRAAGMRHGDGVEFFLDEGALVLMRHRPRCVFCGSRDGVVYLRGRGVCPRCREKLLEAPAGRRCRSVSRRGILARLGRGGRLHIPPRAMTASGLLPGDDVEFFLDGDFVVVRRRKPGCFFCGRRDGLFEFSGRSICCGCALEMASSVRGCPGPSPE